MFAGAVMLGDLDDFIVPSQACVNPLFARPKDAAADAEKPGNGQARIAIDSDLL